MRDGRSTRGGRTGRRFKIDWKLKPVSNQDLILQQDALGVGEAAVCCGHLSPQQEAQFWPQHVSQP